MHDFTPLPALAGGALIGLAASLLLLSAGRIAGISGITGGLLFPVRGDVRWRAWFALGLFAAGIAAVLFAPDSIGSSPRSHVALAVAGLLVGIGTRLGNGCTSGHGVCGISRLAPRSIAATVVFMTTGMLAVVAARWLGVGS
ncbi:MAG TPA: YeeE/YedE thiosulfate transporter family protein [Polyangiales bacterium]|nr:YeeE/YedE thiosulfate transporter family protein [Polyangiales bacterium]